MFGSVAVSTNSIQDYVSVVGKVAFDELRRLAGYLEGARILVLSSPVAGGAARSLLQSSVSLLANLGIDTKWQQVRVASGHREVNGLMRRALSGYDWDWSSTIWPVTSSCSTNLSAGRRRG
jgi:hypothetical protein